MMLKMAFVKTNRITNAYVSFLNIDATNDQPIVQKVSAYQKINLAT